MFALRDSNKTTSRVRLKTVAASSKRNKIVRFTAYREKVKGFHSNFHRKISMQFKRRHRKNTLKHAIFVC